MQHTGRLPSCIQKIVPLGKVSSGQHFAHRLSYVFVKSVDYLNIAHLKQ